MDLHGSKHLIELPNLSQAPKIRVIYLDECEKLAQIHSSSILGNLSFLSMRDCLELRHINVGSNIKETRSGLVAVYNFLNLVDFSFHKLTLKIFVSNHGNIFSGFQIELTSVLLSEYMDDIESAKLKVSSLLPFVTTLRWLDLPIEFGNFSKHFSYLSHHEEQTNEEYKLQINELKVIARQPLELEEKMIISEEVTYFSSDYEKGRPLEVEEEIITEVECCCNIIDGLTRVPNSITRWSLLTQLTLQKSEIIESEVRSNIPGLSVLKSLAESDCKRIQPLIDFRMSLDEVAATKWDIESDLDIDIWRPLAGGFYVHFPVRINLDSISFLFWPNSRRIRRGS